MSGRITVWGASQLLTTFFARSTEPPPTFWLALIGENEPTPYMSGLEISEPDVDDYNRIEIPNFGDYWSNMSQPHVMSCSLPVTFNTASSDWGVVANWALCNIDVGGMTYFVGDLESPVLVEAGDQVVIAEDDLSVSLGPFFLAEEI